MTNLEWIRTLSAEELSQWFYDEWLARLQYRWSSSQGGLVIWLKEQRNEQTEPMIYPQVDGITPSVIGKTENCSEKPNNCEHITEDGVTCAKYPACDDCLDNPLNKVKGSERLVKGKGEPQTYKINPKEPTNMPKCFDCEDFFTCGGQCDEIECEKCQTDRW